MAPLRTASGMMLLLSIAIAGCGGKPPVVENSLQVKVKQRLSTVMSEAAALAALTDLTEDHAKLGGTGAVYYVVIKVNDTERIILDVADGQVNRFAITRADKWAKNGEYLTSDSTPALSDIDEWVSLAKPAAPR